MADTKYSLAGAQNIALSQIGSASQTSGDDSFKVPLTGLNLALSTSSLDIRLLVAEQVKLREALMSLNNTLLSRPSLLNTNASGATPSGEPKSKLKAEIDQRSPPDFLKSAMAIESAMIELNQVLKLDDARLQKLSQANLQMASDKQVAPSGATAVQLAQVELAAVTGGIGKGLDPAKQQDELLSFTRDSAVMASAFNLDVKTGSEMLLAWRTSMKLDRVQGQDLADAINHLGNSGLKVKAADIGSVVQRSAEEGAAAGMPPEQVAALAAAFLNSGVDKAGASAAVNGFVTVLAKGDAASSAQHAAWAELGTKFNPRMLADGLRSDAPGTIKSVLEALKQKTPEEQQSLTKTLFVDNTAILELLKKQEDVSTAFSLVSDKNKFATSALAGKPGSVAQTAEALGESSQGRWNALEASRTRMFAGGGSALAPLTDGVMVALGALADGLSEVAESQPKTTAGLLVLAAAIALSRGAEIKVAMASAITAAATKLLVLAGARLSPVSDELEAGAKKGGKKGSRGSNKGIAANRSKAPSKSAATSVAKVSHLSPETRLSLSGAARMGSAVTGKLAPLMLLSAGYDVIKGLETGDKKAVGGALGSAGGGLAGAYAGAAAGAMIGSVVPIVGTAVGGVIGGLLGGMAGSQGGTWLGEKLATASDQLGAPGQVSKDLTSAQAPSQQVNFNPVIQISGADPGYSEQMVEKVMAQLRLQFNGEFVPLMTTNPLATRRDAALTDGGK